MNAQEQLALDLTKKVIELAKSGVDRGSGEYTAVWVKAIEEAGRIEDDVFSLALLQPLSNLRCSDVLNSLSDQAKAAVAAKADVIKDDLLGGNTLYATVRQKQIALGLYVDEKTPAFPVRGSGPRTPWHAKQERTGYR